MSLCLRCRHLRTLYLGDRHLRSWYLRILASEEIGSWRPAPEELVSYRPAHEELVAFLSHTCRRIREQSLRLVVSQKQSLAVPAGEMEQTLEELTAWGDSEAFQTMYYCGRLIMTSLAHVVSGNEIESWRDIRQPF